MQVVVLSPHRDDAAFSCGVLIPSLLRAGTSVLVLNVCTVSDYAPYLAPDGNDRLEQVSAVRSAEDAACFAHFAAIAQAEGSSFHAIDLGWHDAPIRLGCSVDEVLHSLPSQNEIARLAEVFATLPDVRWSEVDLTVAPLALGGHLDHRMVRDAALATVGQDAILCYEDLPYVCRLEEAQPAAEAAAALPFAAQGLWFVGDAVLKQQLTACYPSQIAQDVVDEMNRYTVEHGGAEQVYGSDAARERLWACLQSRQVAAEGSGNA